MFIKIIFIAILILLSGNITADNYYFKHFGIKEGLSQQTILCAIQDKKGFIWFGTKIGLNRFDGIRFKQYLSNKNNKYSLIDNQIFCMTESTNGVIWIGTANGLCKYDPVKDMFEAFNNEDISINGSIYNLTFDKQENLWVTNSDGIYCLNFRTDKYLFFSSKDYFIPSSITVTKSGSIWFSSLDGNIYLYNQQRQDFYKMSILTEQEKKQHVLIHKMLECPNGDLIIATDRVGVKLFSPNNSDVTTLFKNDSYDNPIYIHTIAQVNEDDFWIGTENGIYIYSLKNGFIKHIQKSYNNEYSLSDNAVHVLLKDREDGIWVGTFFGGVNYLSNDQTFFSRYLPKNNKGEIVANVIREIHSDDNGNLWIGTEDGGLCNFNIKNGMFDSVKWNNYNINRNIQCLMIDKNNIWIGTFDNGIYLYDLYNKKIVKHYCTENNSGLLVNSIVSIKKISNNDILIGTMGGLYLYNPFNDNFEQFNDLNWGLVHSIYEDLNKTIWIGTMGRGLFKIKNDSNPKYVEHVPFVSDYITTINEDSRKRLWIGTEGNGFFLYDRQKENAISTLSSNEYNSGNIVYQIIEDASGILWITTSKGLLYYDVERNIINNFTTINGLHLEQFNYNSSYLDLVGNIYLGTVNGMISFSPEKLINSVNKPLEVLYTGFYLYDKEVDTKQFNLLSNKSVIFTKEIVLPYDQSTFSIDYSALNYSTSQDIWYRYKLHGVDFEWNINKGPRRLYYTKLPPGKYLLQVQASMNNQKWENKITDLTIIVTPPFWQTPFFYSMYFVLITLTLIAIYVKYKKKIKIREIYQIEKIQNEKYKESLLSKINFFTNIAHEIRTPLTLIMGSLNRIVKYEKGNVEDDNIIVMKKSTQRLLDLVNQLLDFRKVESSVFLMSFVTLNLNHLLKETYTRFTPIIKNKNINFNIEYPNEDLEVVADKEAILKILSNLFNNAIKFCDNTINVYLKKVSKNNELVARIRIDNDGNKIPSNKIEEIFKPFYQCIENINVPSNGSGLGLPLARSLVKMHNGELYLDPLITDMNSFVVDLPLEQHNYESIETSPYYVENIKHDNAKSDNKKYTLLIVEDEPEVRRFICEELISEYNILVAENGKVALELLEEHVVSLIISDLMMPVMDGISLCKSVKSNVKYCHIPIVILTAKVSLQAHIEVLESKADAYIEKPFSTEHLLVQIENLLSNRELMKTTFVNSPHAHIIGVASNSIDKKFIERMNNYVINNLSTNNLSVETLAEYMNMSVSTLYRKVKAITSLAPNDYIRLCRLKKAAELLAKGDLRINEVASKLGFSTTSYFTSCFLKQFGLTPSEFVKLNNKENNENSQSTK